MRELGACLAEESYGCRAEVICLCMVGHGELSTTLVAFLVVENKVRTSRVFGWVRTTAKGKEGTAVALEMFK